MKDLLDDNLCDFMIDALPSYCFVTVEAHTSKRGFSKKRSRKKIIEAVALMQKGAVRTRKALLKTGIDVPLNNEENHLLIDEGDLEEFIKGIIVAINRIKEC